jgi:hypothetical protein
MAAVPFWNGKTSARFANPSLLSFAKLAAASSRTGSCALVFVRACFLPGDAKQKGLYFCRALFVWDKFYAALTPRTFIYAFVYFSKKNLFFFEKFSTAFVPGQDPRLRRVFCPA